MAKLLHLDVAQLTDVGRKREHNEDNMAYVIPKDPAVMAHKGALFIVADGMGGHAAGEVASEIAVDTVSNAYYQNDNDDVPASLLYAIRRANTAIHQRAAENMLRSGMGTTCVAAVLRGNMAYIANVGDSRAYLIRKSHIRQVSQDHSWVAEQVRAGLLTEEQARTHAQRNVITRSLGTTPEVEIDIFRETLEEGDTLILCSDGLSGLVNDEEMLRTVDQFVPQESVYHLVERANENGGPDNITAIVAQIQGVGVEPPNVRQPVPVGGPELSNENTARLFAQVGAGVNVVARNGEIPVSGGPFPYSSGPLASPESDTAPQPAIRAQKREHSRLFVPSLVLLILFILAVGVGGFYYFLHTNQAQQVASTLDSANQQITQARGILTNNPAQALQDLSRAQQQLQDLQKNYTLNASMSSRLADLQNQLVSETKTAIINYNQRAQISLLPCTTSAPSGVNNGTSGTQAQAVTLISGNNAVLYYALGHDGKIYQLSNGNNQFTLAGSPFPSDANTHITSFAAANNKIFALSAQTNNNAPGTYAINMLSPGTNMFDVQSKNIDTTLTQDGKVPTLITAWGNNVYVVLSSRANPNTATILSYSGDSKNPFNGPIQKPISVSADITSIAAFPNQLFLLLADGEMRSSQINPTNSTLSDLIPVSISTPIAPPLATGAQNFVASTPVPTATVTSQQGSGPLTVPMASATNPATMSAGSEGANSAPHLFIGDPANHRVLDLVIQPAGSTGGPASTPTSTSSTNLPITLNLVQQYASPSYFNAIKSVATDPTAAPNGTTIYILGQNIAKSESLVVVSTGTQRACIS